MKKEERLLLEQRTQYVVAKAFGQGSETYSVKRLLDNIQEEIYFVTVTWEPKVLGQDRIPKVLWCDCMGFRMQKYAYVQHKHIKLVIDFQKRGDPLFAMYRIRGTGGKAVIEHLHSYWEDKHEI